MTQILSTKPKKQQIVLYTKKLLFIFKILKSIVQLKRKIKNYNNSWNYKNN